jgi:hypothetical protein
MPQTRLKCKRCKHPLSDARVKANKRTCTPCERLIKQEQSAAAHEKRVCEQYGLRPGEYDKLYKAQNGHCAIKGCKARGVYIRLAVEHNHKLGFTRVAIRGLVCKSHNKWIAWAGDDPEVFDSIAGYLRDPPAQHVLNDDAEWIREHMAHE